MRYMLLVYSTEPPDGLSPAEAAQVRDGHWQVIQEATSGGVLQAA